MSRGASRNPAKHKASVLEGAPPWITEELIASTLLTWQPRYAKQLTDHDAIEILLAVDQLFEVLGEQNGETLRRTSASIEP